MERFSDLTAWQKAILIAGFVYLTATMALMLYY